MGSVELETRRSPAADTTDVGAGGRVSWQEFVPLDVCLARSPLPRCGGLYRIRRLGQLDLDYIGQTGEGRMTLARRVAMLRGVLAAEMPYSDPHTAAPGLWALRDAARCEFEVSVAPVEADKRWRKSLEAVAISRYRHQVGRSPTLNFGRMPPGYRKSTGNNARLVAAGLRCRGGRTPDSQATSPGSVPPMGDLAGDPMAADWQAHAWTPWAQARTARSVAGTGLYRLRQPGGSGLVYIGEGLIASRVVSHLRRAAAPQTRLADSLGDPATLQASWTVNSWPTAVRLEFENDLIAGHVIRLGHAPAAQFRG